jgi:hypothetical protein
MTVFRGNGARKDLLNEIYDGVAACAKLLDDFQLVGGFPVQVIWGAVGDETDGFALEVEAISDNVAWCQDILDWLRCNGTKTGGGLELGAQVVGEGDWTGGEQVPGGDVGAAGGVGGRRKIGGNGEGGVEGGENQSGVFLEALAIQVIRASIFRQEGQLEGMLQHESDALVPCSDETGLESELV